MKSEKDLTLPSWGPYSPRTFGLAYIHDPEQGSRMDFTLMPGFYRRSFAVPDARRQSGGLPWQSSPDLRFYSYRQQLEWKDRVYADMRFISCGENCRLISCELVNRKKRSVDLALALLCRLVPGSAARCTVSGALETLVPRLPGRGLNFNALQTGESPAEKPFPGGTIFHVAKHCCVRFEADSALKGKFIWLLKKGADGRWDFYPLPGAEEKFFHYIPDDDEILNRAFVTGTADKPVLDIQPDETVPKIIRTGPGKYLLAFGNDRCYALCSPRPPAFSRSYHVRDLDALFTRGDLVFQPHLGDSFTEPDAGEDGFAVSLQPLNIPSRSRRKFDFYIAAGPQNDMMRFLNGALPVPDAVKPVSFAPSSCVFGAERLAATVMTNIVYPVRCGGKPIRHHTPGRLWSSLYTWDSGFIGLALLEMDILRAKENLNAYLTSPGDPEGAFVLNGTPLPVQLFLLFELWNRTCDRKMLRYFYPRAKQMYLYLAGHAPGSTTRRHCTLPLISTWDYFYNSGGWDDYPPQWSRRNTQPPPRVIPMIASAVLVRGAKMLRALGRILDDDTSIFDRDIREISDAVQVAWDPESGYFGYVETDPFGKPLGIYRFRDGSNYNMGLDGVSPLYADEISSEQKKRLWRNVRSRSRLWTKYGVSAVDQSAPYFSFDGYWNGSIWMPHQWFLWKAALNDGMGDFAVKIALTALRLWERETRAWYCCFEHFSIRSGSGGGWHHFSGLSSPVLCWYNSCFKPGTLSWGYDVLITAQSRRQWTLEISGRTGERTSLLFCGEPEKILYRGENIPFRRISEKTVCFELPKNSGGTLLIVSGAPDCPACSC